MTNKERTLARYMQDAMKKEYGFAPAAIQLDIFDYHLNPDGTPQYVGVMIGNHVYSYDGITLVHKKNKP